MLTEDLKCIFLETKMKGSDEEMCGIFGVSDLDLDIKRANKACNLLSHRGPDLMNSWSDIKNYIGQTRLSINDLSEKGNQPFVVDGKVVVAVNGEIYNYKELKYELEKKYIFQSSSDSEIIVHGFLEWGIEALLEKIDGMYAVSIFDIENNKIYLARDRVGIKPLYYSDYKDIFVWSSELKAIKEYYIDSELVYDNTALYDFLTYLYIPTPKTLFKDVYKLEPGYYIEYSVIDKKINKKQYWDLKIIENKESLDKVIENVEKIIEESVKEHLLSDIPIGAFLSGGIDSSIVAYETHKHIKNLETYTIGFDEKTHDESKYAKLLANSIGVNNRLYIMNKNFMSSNNEDVIRFFDEPFGDSSMFPTYFLSKVTKEHATVVVSGDGGDEIFGGYTRYDKFSKIKNSKKLFSKNKYIKKLMAKDNFYARKTIRKLFKYINFDDMELITYLLGGMIAEEKTMYKYKLNIPMDYDDYWFFRKYYNENLTTKKRLQYLDFKTYLPEDILTKVDRTSMKCALEVRVPFLGKKLFEYVFSLPEEHIYLNDKLKGLLIEIYRDKLPEDILFRKKMGFSIPQKKWKKSYLGKYLTWQEKVLNEYFLN